MMEAPPPPKEENIEAEYSPQAVIDWYEFTGGSQVYKRGRVDGDEKNKKCGARELSTKAKKHLLSLGWSFWYADKKTRYELRYKSPNGKNYISLKTACKGCIKDGVYGPPLRTRTTTVEPSSTISIPSSSSSEAHTTSAITTLKEEEEQQQHKQPRAYNKTRVQPRRCNKKEQRRRSDSSENELSRKCKKKRKRESESSSEEEEEEEEEEWSLESNKRATQCTRLTPDDDDVNKGGGKVLRSSKRATRDGSCDDDLSSSLRKHSEGCGDSSPIHGHKGGKVLRSRDENRDSPSMHKPRTVISWLIDKKVVSLEAKVHYRGGKNKNNVMKRGRLLRDGIACDCCGSVFSLTRFEDHAGSTKHRPSANIFLDDDGRSLMDCQMEARVSLNYALMSQGFVNYLDQSDNICSICHYGGDLMLCDRCPSAFHHTCLGLEKVPDGDWFCSSCCCKICNKPRFSDEDGEAKHEDNSVLCCDQCERKYHIGCLKSKGFAKLKECVNENWFCNSDCENIFFSLQKLIGKTISLEADNLTLTFLKKTLRCDGNYSDDELEGLSQIENRLSVALGVMHECFEPITDVTSGRDIVADVIFSKGSRFNRLNFAGFYTVTLERNDEVISVAIIRVYGQRVAEVPLVATRRQFRRQGMCRILMNEIEKVLAQFGVERLVLPAARDVVETWTTSFGFARMTDADKYQLREYTFLDFQDSILCHKPLKK
ncbi:hypothetical protein RIF29_12653 [Crotalaria pallida]|uniref:Uncharacterized protein n=1 Tax=Crotalaria pallida TaxID=3830 RepID=A0AAN9P1Y4_CROPI